MHESVGVEGIGEDTGRDRWATDRFYLIKHRATVIGVV